MPATCFDPLCFIFREEPDNSLMYKTRNSDKIMLTMYDITLCLEIYNGNRNVNNITCAELDFRTVVCDYNCYGFIYCCPRN